MARPKKDKVEFDVATINGEEHPIKPTSRVQEAHQCTCPDNTVLEQMALEIEQLKEVVACLGVRAMDSSAGLDLVNRAKARIRAFRREIKEFG